MTEVRVVSSEQEAGITLTGPRRQWSWIDWPIELVPPLSSAQLCFVVKGCRKEVGIEHLPVKEELPEFRFALLTKETMQGSQASYYRPSGDVAGCGNAVWRVIRADGERGE